MMTATLPNGLTTTLYEIEDVEAAEKAARAQDGQIYCWKTLGNQNWLERGLSVVDVLGLVILPKGLDEVIDMPDDEIEF